MIVKLSKVGDELALVINRDTLDKLGADSETAFEVRVSDHSLVATPQNTPSRISFEEAMAEVDRQYEKTFRRLAE